MPVQLSGSLLMSGSITATGLISAQGGISSVGAQQITDLSNPISFTSTASLYTDGGIRVTKDMFVSGTAYFNNVTIYGTQSVEYITSSQLNIGTNIITVNTDTPTVRYGGLAVYDSGSTGLTGSLLWDSEANHWIYTNPSGSTYSGGMMISGPRASARGCEQGTTSCALMVGQGGDHITSSAVFHYGNATCFYGNATIQSSGATCLASTLSATKGTFTGTGYVLDLNRTDNTALIQLQYNGTVGSLLGTTGANNLTVYNASAAPMLNLTSGIGCFSGAVCAPAFVGGTVNGTTGTFSSNAASLTFGANDTVEKYMTIRFSNGDFFVGGTSVQNYIYGAGSRNLALWTNSTQRFLIDGNGVSCFACQTCTPALDIMPSGIGVSTLGGIMRVVTGGTAVGIGVGQSNTNRYTQISANDLLVYNDDFFIATRCAFPLSIGTCYTSRLTFAATGIACFACRVCAPVITAGAGTSSQAIKITGDDNYIEFDNAGTYIKGGGNLTAAATSTFLLSTSANTRLTIAPAGEAVFACQVCMPVLLASGCVGIGNTSPLGSLHIGAALASSGDAAAVILKQTSTTAASGLYIERSAEQKGYYIYISGANDSLTFQRNNSGTKSDVLALSRDTIACFSNNVCVGGVLVVNGSTINVNCDTTTATDARMNLYTRNSVNGDRASIYTYNLSATTGGYELTYLAFGYCCTNNQGYINMQTKSGGAWCNTMYLINGRVGIGTDAPNYKLEVNGTSCFAGNVAIGGSYCAFALNVHGVTYQIGGSTWVQNGYGYVNAGATTTGLFPLSDNTIQLKIANSAALTIDSSYNVGIGTTTPAKPLELRTGGTSTTPSQIFNGGISQAIVGGEAQLAFSSNISPTTGLTTASELTRAGIGFQYISAASPSEFSIGIQCTNVCNSNVRFFNGVERMRITSTGIACFACQVCSGVGFYASSLQSGITIDSTTNGDTIIASRGLSTALHGIVRTVGQNGVTCMQIISTRDSVDGNLPASVNALWGLTNHAMVIATCNTERMRITNAGRVGIGNTAPVSALVVSTTTDVNSLGQSGIVIQGADTLTAGCVLALAFTAIPGTSRARAAVGSVVGSDWGKGNLAFYTRDASDATALSTADERMRITSGGGVVIGGTVASNVGLTIYGSNAATIYQTPNTGTGAGNGFYVGHTGDISYIWNYNNYPTVFATNNTERMRITNCGCINIVGVGNRLNFDTTDGPSTVQLGTVNDYVFRLQNNRGVGTIMDLGNNHIDFYSNGSLRQRIFDYGNVCFACAVCTPAGVRFGGGATTLNYYEEGTFTPRFCSAGFSSITYGSGQNGYYTRIGRLVFISINIMTEAITSSGTNQAVTIRCLPFTSANLNESSVGLTITDNSRYDSCPPINATINPNTNIISLFVNLGLTGAGTDPTPLYNQNFSTGAGNRNITRLSGVYITS